jgi:hypothetical protein
MDLYILFLGDGAMYCISDLPIGGFLINTLFQVYRWLTVSVFRGFKSALYLPGKIFKTVSNIIEANKSSIKS